MAWRQDYESFSYRTVFEKTNWKTENLYILGHRGPYEALK